MSKYTCVKPRNDVPVAKLREAFEIDPDRGWLLKNGRRVGWKHSLGYRYVQVGKRSYKEHRVLWAMFYGTWPKGQIDHINRVKDDNRIANLRDVSPGENQRNAPIRKDNKSGFPGVFNRSGRFIATARRDGKKVYIGAFDTAEAAFEARLAFLSER